MIAASTQSVLPRVLLVAFAGLFCFLSVRLLIAGDTSGALLVVGIAAVPYLLYAALLRPLIFPFGLYILLVPFDNLLGSGSGGTITKMLGIAAGIFFILLAVRRKTAGLSGISMVLLAVLAAWMAISMVWALDQEAALQIMPTYAGLFLLYIALSMIKLTLKEFKFVLFLIVVSGLCAAIYGANAFYTDPSLVASDPTTTRLVVQSGNQSIDPNHFANALLLPLAIIIMWTLRNPRLLGKLAGMAIVTLMTVALFLSGSREALGGLMLIVLYFIWRSRYRAQVAIAAALVLSFAITVQTSIWTRMAMVFSDGGSGRTSIWSVGWEAAKHRWLQGYGIGNFPTAYDLYYIGVHQLQPYGWSSPAHNIVLHYVVELGIIGFAMIVGFFYFEFRSMRRIERDSELYDYRLVMEASLLAIAFVALTIDLFTYKYAWLVFSTIVLLRNIVPEEVQSRGDILSPRPATLQNISA